MTVTYYKFDFKIPAEGYLFNENDCWVQVIGNRARVGISDFVQQSMTDITYFEPAEVGRQVEQFDEVGSLESGKSMMDVLSPVSGRVVAVNTQLADTPELANEDPYGKGWIAEIELRDFESDRELLLDAEAYSKVVEKKAAEAQH
ncbi:MAG: glycine cleavage system protein H [Armatimonadota bacterium]